MGQLLRGKTWMCLPGLLAPSISGPAGFSGFQTVPLVSQLTVPFLTPTGSSHVWQMDTSRCEARSPELSFIHSCDSHFTFPLIYHIYNVCCSPLSRILCCVQILEELCWAETRSNENEVLEVLWLSHRGSTAQNENYLNHCFICPH